MTYIHTVLAPKELVFEPEYRECPYCHKRIQKHIVCEGARWHVTSWFSNFSGTASSICSESDCERNHGPGKCIKGGN